MTEVKLKTKLHTESAFVQVRCLLFGFGGEVELLRL